MHTINLIVIILSIQYISSQKNYEPGQVSNARSGGVSGRTASRVSSSIKELEEVTNRSNGRMSIKNEENGGLSGKQVSGRVSGKGTSQKNIDGETMTSGIKSVSKTNGNLSNRGGSVSSRSRGIGDLSGKTINNIDPEIQKAVEQAKYDAGGVSQSRSGETISNKIVSTYTMQYGSGNDCMRKLSQVSGSMSYDELKEKMQPYAEPEKNIEWYIGNGKQSVVYGCSPHKYVDLQGNTRTYSQENSEFKCASKNEYELLKNINKDNLVVDTETNDESSTIGLRNLCAYLTAKTGNPLSAAELAAAAANLQKHPHMETLKKKPTVISVEKIGVAAPSSSRSGASSMSKSSSGRVSQSRSRSRSRVSQMN